MPISEILFSTQGRIRRSQYWAYTMALSFVASIFYGVFVFVSGAIIGVTQDGQVNGIVVFWLAIFLIHSFIIFMWMSVCISAKRWHDRDKSGWFYLVIFIPFFGLIWSFIELGILDGTQGENKYGPSPKGISYASGVFS